ncbi:MAG: hypothetical protein E7I47_12620 [Clostridium sp.]|uniref:hypothetical protein n=1 Tax=Clostridium sp. TaxID=1506 RepID=UPI002908489E|nr:hypothetical protein [Clostridium sp.]MDU4320142.1 hypothetical protein [Clostridium sp.]
MEDKKIEELEKEINNLKNNKSFVEQILANASKLEFININNLIQSVLGLLSPVVPILFLYRSDVINKINITGAIFIGITINAILLIGTSVIFQSLIISMMTGTVIRAEKINSFNKFAIKLFHKDTKKLEMYVDERVRSIKENGDYRKYRIRINILRVKGGIFKFVLTRSTRKVDNLIYKFKKIKEKDDNLIFYFSVFWNILLGGTVVLGKMLTYMELSSINFQGMLKQISICFLLIAIYGLVLKVLRIYNKIMKKIYDSINKKKIIESQVEQYEQLGFF